MYTADELCITLPYRLEVNITRLPDAYKDSKVVFRWSLWNCLAEAQFILLHEKAPGQLEKVDVGKYGKVCLQEEIQKAAGLEYNADDVWKLSSSPPRNTASCSVTLPANYQTKLIAGERYHLLWPGGRIDSWDCDTEQQHVNLSTYPRAGEKPPIVLLPAVGIVFKAVEPDEPRREKIPDPEDPYRSFERANAMEELLTLLRRAVGNNPPNGCTTGRDRRGREAAAAARARRRERRERRAAQYDSGYFTE